MASMADVWAKAAAVASRWLGVAVLAVFILGRAAAASARRRGSSRSTSAGRLPPMGQQLLDSAVQLRRQSGEHVLEVGPGLVPVELGRLKQAHHDGSALAGQLTADEQPIAASVNAGQDPLLCDGEDADLVLSVHVAAARGVAT